MSRPAFTIAMLGLVVAAPVLGGCGMYPRPIQHPDVGMRPAAWASAGLIEVDMTGVSLPRGRSIAAAIQRDPAEPDTRFAQEPAYASGMFSAGDAKIQVRPGVDYRGGLESVIVYETEKDVFGAVDFLTGLTELPGVASRPAPSAETPTPALFSHVSPASWWGSDAAATATLLDARESVGTGLVYAWDLNGDGSYGDDPRGGWVSEPPPTGTAYVPSDVVWRASGAGQIEVGVRVTNAGGGEATKRIPLAVRGTGAGRGYAFRAGSEDRIQPEHGNLQTDRGIAGATYFACLDIGDDGTWDQAPIETFPVFGSPGLWSFPASWVVSLPPGRVRVAIAYYGQVLPTADCTATGAIISTTRFLVTRDAAGGVTGGVSATAVQMERGPYRTATRLGVTVGTMLARGAFDGPSFTWRGIVSAGHFAMPLPLRARGSRRPGALGQFTRGTFVSRSDTTIGAAARSKARAVAVGTTTLLARGTGGALACFRITRTPTTTTWVLSGGTGAARRLDVTLTGPPTTLAALQAMERRRVLRPTTARYTVRASAGVSPRGLPSDCRALRGRLTSAP